MREKFRKRLSELIIFIFLFQCCFGTGSFVLAQSLLVPENEVLQMIVPFNEDSEEKEPILSTDVELEEKKLQSVEQKLQQQEQQLEKNFSEEPSLLLLEQAFDDQSVVKEENFVYANGIPIVIKEENGLVYIFDETGKTKLLPDSISANTSIYGGGLSKEVDSTSITMQGGTVANIIGGGRSGCVKNNTNITITGGTVTGLVCGGSKERAGTVAQTNIFISGNTSIKWVYGGGYQADVTGDTSVILEGGVISYLCGGGYQGKVEGNTSVCVKDTEITNTLFGGGWHSEVAGNTEIIFGQGAQAQYLCGGGYLFDENKNSNAKIGKDTAIIIEDGTVLENVYCGGWNSEVAQAANLTISGGILKNVYGGGYNAAIGGKTSVHITGGIISESLYGGGQTENAFVPQTEITFSGGTIGWLYTGGWKAKAGTAKLFIDGGEVQNIAFGGGHLESATVEKTQVTVSNSDSKVKYLFGGGEWAPVSDTTNVTIQNGAIENTYGGGRTVNASVKDSSIVIENGTMQFLYGGGREGSCENTSIEIKNGSIESVYGGAATGSVKNTSVTIQDGTIGFLYGAGKEGEVSEASTITVYNGTITKNMFGGGRGENSTVYDTEVIIYGGSINNVFAGGDKGKILNQSALTILEDAAIAFAGGGGYSGDCENTSITLLGGNVKAVYGSGYSGNCKRSDILIENAQIDQIVVASGTGGQAEIANLIIKGGFVKELYPGYAKDSRLVYEGGSILKNYAGSIVNPKNTPVYPVIVSVGAPVLCDQSLICQIDKEVEWKSKTDSVGKMVIYLPEEEKTILAKDTSGILYYGKVTANPNEAVLVTLLEGGEIESYAVKFSVKQGEGSLEVQANGVPIPLEATVMAGSHLVITAKPEMGFYLANWYLNGQKLEQLDNPYIIRSISENVNLEAVFEKEVINKENLQNAVVQAEQEQDCVQVSVDGSDIETSQQWVSRAIMNQFQDQIQKAKTVLLKPFATQAEVNTQTSELLTAIDEFQKAKQFGNKTNISIDKTKLNKLITQLRGQILEVAVSMDGFDIGQEQKWVTQAEMNAVLSVVQQAEAIADNLDVSQAEIDAMYDELKSAQNTFLFAQKDGKQEKKVPFTFQSIGLGSVTASLNGKQIQSPYAVSPDDTIILQAKSESGYQISQWVSNGQVINGTNEALTLTDITQPTSVIVYFKEIEEKGYFVTVANTIKGGLVSVSPSGILQPGMIVKVSILPDEGYVLLEGSLKYNGEIIENNQFVMPAQDVIITAEFVPDTTVPKYLLTVTSGTGGQVSAGGIYAEGEQATIIAYPSSGYVFKAWESADENYIKSLTSAKTTITMPNKPMQVKAIFRKLNSGGGGGGNTTNPNLQPPKNPILPEQSPNIRIEKNETNVEAILTVQGQADEKASAIIQINQKDILEALSMAKSEAGKKQILLTVNSSITKPENTNELNTIHLVVPKKAIQEMGKLELSNQPVLYLKTEFVSMRFDYPALLALLPKEQDSIQITVSKASNLTKQALDMLGGRAAYEFLILSDHKQITQFGSGKVQLEFPYSLQPGEKAEKVKGVYIDASGLGQVLEESTYSQEQKRLEILTSHFSIFGVGYLKEEKEEAKGNFIDIKDHWAKRDIQKLANQKIVSGITETIFQPDEPMTRAMLVTILGRAGKIDTTEYEYSSKFLDIEGGAYYLPYVTWAQTAKVVNGTAETTFSPNLPITREQLAVMLYQFAQYMEIPLEHTQEEILFSDEQEISNWAKQAVSQLQQAGILYGKDTNTFAPQNQATRAEVCAVIVRLLEVN